MPEAIDQRNPAISTLADAEGALRRLDRETRAWETATLEARANDAMDEADMGTHMLIGLLLAFVVAAACLAVDIVARLPHGH